MAKTGRVSRFKEEYLILIKGFRDQGFSMGKIAESLNISPGTLRNWRLNNPELDEILKQGMPEKGVNHHLGKYREEYDAQAYKLCLLGLTNPELADFFGLSKSTIDNWIEKIPSFRKAVKDGKLVADGGVAEKLYHRASGYSHPAVDFKVIHNQIVETEYTKHYPPDTAAGIFWLKNRQPEKWRDKREISVDGAAELTPWSEVEVSEDKTK